MSELTRIVTQLKQGFEGEAWSGPSLMEILDGVDARIAAAKPIAGAHSIWEITNHLTAGQSIMLARLAGGGYARTNSGRRLVATDARTHRRQLEGNTRDTQDP